MATALTVKTSHPALFATGFPTPPHTPGTPISTARLTPAPPVVNYALLRAHHATALKYVIAKLRWEQRNNGYLREEDAWLLHNRMINKLENELNDVEAAQKGLDRFPNCHAAIAFPKPHGPLSKEQFLAEQKEELEKQRKFDERLEAQFPFIKQLFIGPKTKQQARNDKMLREGLKEGDLEDLSVLLPSENMRMLMAGAPKKERDGKKKVPYEQQRQEKEKAKLAKLQGQADESPKKVSPPPRIGPMTKDEWMMTLPLFGPPTRKEAMLPAQREQRHIILSWLRKPWPVYDEEAAQLMESLGRLALRKMDAEAKEAKIAKERAEAREKEREKQKELAKIKHVEEREKDKGHERKLEKAEKGNDRKQEKVQEKVHREVEGGAKVAVQVK